MSWYALCCWVDALPTAEMEVRPARSAAEYRLATARTQRHAVWRRAAASVRRRHAAVWKLNSAGLHPYCAHGREGATATLSSVEPERPRAEPVAWLARVRDASRFVGANSWGCLRACSLALPVLALVY